MRSNHGRELCFLFAAVVCVPVVLYVAVVTLWTFWRAEEI